MIQRRALLSAAVPLLVGGAVSRLVARLRWPATGVPAISGGWTAVLDVSALTTDGETLVPPIHGPDGAPILVVRQTAKRFLALSMQCTHEGCPVNPPVRGVITCPCHESRFDLSGSVLRGPAQFPLARYRTRYDRTARTLRVAT